MKKRTAELILQDPEKFAHHDRVFLNNPVVMQGMGLAPLVVVATTGQNSLMLAAAVALLLVPSRVLACLLSRLVPLRDEEPTPEQLQKKLLPRALLYAASAAVVYLAARDYDPSFINRYLTELAAAFHKFYNACRIKGEAENVLLARLKLADTARAVLKNGMTLIGCSAPEKM